MSQKSSQGSIHLVLILLVSVVIFAIVALKNYQSNFMASAGKPSVPTPSATPSSTCSLPSITEFNQSLSFLGNSDNNSILVPSPQTIRLSNDFTIEAFIKLAELPMQDTTVSRTIFNRLSTSNTAQVSLSLVPFSTNTMPNPRVKLVVASLPYNSNYLGENLLSTTPILPNTWNHIAVTKQGNNLSMFINGRLEKTLTVAGDTSTDGIYTGQLLDSGDSNITLGGFKYNNPTFGGQPEDMTDEIRISNVARYSGNFVVSKTPFTVDSNTLALYHFDNNAADTTGNNNGQVQGTIQFKDSLMQYSPDSDFDGWSDCSETKIGTNLSRACPQNNKDIVWVPDFNNDKIIDNNDRRIIDNAFDPRTYTDAKYNKRYDLNIDGKLDTKDRNLIEYFINQTCN